MSGEILEEIFSLISNNIYFLEVLRGLFLERLFL